MKVTPTLAVTGATGVLGAFVAHYLAERGIAQRLLVRTPAKAPSLSESTIHRFSYSDQEAAITALRGVETLFMVSAHESPERLDQHRTFVDAAASAGVKHVVYTSFAAAAPDATFTLARDHYVTEEYIKASGMKWTFLRDGFYLDFMEALVGEDGVIRGPAKDGRASFVARADVARTAAAILANPGDHAAQTYNLTGPEALTLDEVAATISRIRGRHITFHNETLDEAYGSRAGYGAPDWQLEAWVSTYTAIASNIMAPVSQDIETITGNAPMNLEEYLTTNPR
ncbi:SDR family oxidoreductase [Arthrobacter sp. efr-133-TYG-104]|uniref:SDR family oxidoreductase n=1 Tax=Arthrobacter sp. efr-133-TYG-104 TaxID=3040324 RepID=UPI00254C6782|nr:SDR family oxidoreductase [Arthrobacter sp. efr-133-TYG-104]